MKALLNFIRIKILPDQQIKAFTACLAMIGLSATAFAKDQTLVKGQVVMGCYSDCKVGVPRKIGGTWKIEEVPAKTFVLIIDHNRDKIKFHASSESWMQVDYDAEIAADGQLTVIISGSSMGPQPAGSFSEGYELEYNNGSAKCSVHARPDKGAKTYFAECRSRANELNFSGFVVRTAPFYPVH